MGVCIGRSNQDGVWSGNAEVLCFFRCTATSERGGRPPGESVNVIGKNSAVKTHFLILSRRLALYIFLIFFQDFETF